MEWEIPKLVPFGLAAHGDCGTGESASAGCVVGDIPNNYWCVSGDTVLSACAEGSEVYKTCVSGDGVISACNPGGTFN